MKKTPIFQRLLEYLNESEHQNISNNFLLKFVQNIFPSYVFTEVMKKTNLLPISVNGNIRVKIFKQAFLALKPEIIQYIQMIRCYHVYDSDDSVLIEFITTFEMRLIQQYTDNCIDLFCESTCVIAREVL